MLDFESLFVEASQKKRRAKILFYGTFGTGKTLLSLNFPRPVMIDLERGSECYHSNFSFKVFHTTDPEKVRQGVEWLKQNKTDRDTIILDSMTEYWSALQSKWSEVFLRRNKGKGNKEEYYDLQPRDWGQIKNEFKDFLRSLLALDMNVICTCRVKDLYSEEVMLKKVGETIDCDRNLPYLFDTVVRLEKTTEGRYMAKVEKDRTNLLPPIFEANYTIFAYAFGLENFDVQVIPDANLPMDLRGKGLSGLNLATENIEWLNKEGKKYKSRQLLHMWVSEKNPDNISKTMGRRLLEKYPLTATAVEAETVAKTPEAAASKEEPKSTPSN